MYLCNSCKRTFETPGTFVNEEYYGCMEELERCPKCDNFDFGKAERCTLCGEFTPVNELTDGMCEKCEKEIQDKVDGLFRQFNEEEIKYIFESGILEGYK